MRSTTQTWKNIVAKGEFNMETVARVYGATGNDTNGTSGSDSRGNYKEYNTITAPTITRALLSGESISVGNAIAAQMNFTLMTTDTIPKSAMIVIRSRVTNGTTSSEWLEFGTFFIDHRTITDDLIDIESYDSMKKGNQPYSDNSQSLNWPKSIKVVVQRIAQQMGVTIDSRTQADIINNANIGDLEIVYKLSDETTLLDMLKYLGEVLGGNWTITETNALRFIGLVSPADETYYIVDEAHNLIKTNQNDHLIWQGESKEHEEQTHPLGGGICYVPVVIGSLTTADKYTISKVTIGMDADHVYTIGDNTGYELVCSANNPYANDETAQLLYDRVNGVEYAPYEATNAIFDPAAELGDWIVMGEVYGVLYNETCTLDFGFSADISSPGHDEMEDEFPYQTIAQKTEYAIEKQTALINTVQSEITQLPDAIMLEVSEIYQTIETSNSRYASLTTSINEISAEVSSKVDESEIRSKFALDPTNITLSAGTDSQGNPTGTITMNAGTLIVNGTNFSLTRQGVMSCRGANIKGTLDVEYIPPVVPAGATDPDLSIKIDENGITLKRENSQTASIHEDVSYEIAYDPPRLVDSGPIFEAYSGLPITMKSTGKVNLIGNSIYLDSSFLYVKDSQTSTGYSAGKDANIGIGAYSLSFVNGILVSYVLNY